MKVSKEELKYKVFRAKAWCAETVEDGLDFVKDHKEELVLAVPLVVSVVGGVAKVTSSTIRNHAVDKEIRFKERTIYDRSLGRYVELRHKLTTKEALEIEERRDSGERLMTILSDMRLLK